VDDIFFVPDAMSGILYEGAFKSRERRMVAIGRKKSNSKIEWVNLKGMFDLAGSNFKWHDGMNHIITFIERYLNWEVSIKYKEIFIFY
jgi:hypothetical protein